MQVAEEDLQRVAQATGAAVQTTVNELDPRVLGTCRHFEEVQVRRRCAGLVLHAPFDRLAPDLNEVVHRMQLCLCSVGQALYPL